MNPVYLVCCIGVSEREFFCPAMLRHFCEHYLGAGIRPENFLLTLHSVSDTDNIDSVTKYLSYFHIGVSKTIITEQWDCFEFYRTNNELVKRLDSKSWIVMVDFDEFIHFPKCLGQFIEELEAGGFDLAMGQLVDRVAPAYGQFIEELEAGGADSVMRRLVDGGAPAYELSEITLDRPLWDQFPVVTDISGTLARTNHKKTCILRNHLTCTLGHHSVTCPTEAHVYPRGVPVYHFKWDATLIPKLAKRKIQFEKDPEKFWWKHEIDNVLNRIEGTRLVP